MRLSIYRRLVVRLSLSPPFSRVINVDIIVCQYVVNKDMHWHAASGITAMFFIAPNAGNPA